MELLYFPQRAQWREWLDRHHDNETEAHLKFYKKSTGKPSLTLDDAVEEALCYGWIDSVMHGIDSECYELRFSPRKPKSRWSESNIARVKRLIADGQMTPAGMKAIPDGLLDGSLEHSWAPLMNNPSLEFLFALDADAEAKRFYETLPVSQKEMYAGWINSAKRPETRARRIAEAIGLLHDGKRLGMK
jgi:uncharacterized protein YdeI (YjbR/CyaY-like superfamily)